eukprot:scaffold12737_cov115-Isochrysis_galbana.AAC.1
MGEGKGSVRTAGGQRSPAMSPLDKVLLLAACCSYYASLIQLQLPIGSIGIGTRQQQRARARHARARRVTTRIVRVVGACGRVGVWSVDRVACGVRR